MTPNLRQFLTILSTLHPSVLDSIKNINMRNAFDKKEIKAQKNKETSNTN